ncbi:hypothetical protein IKF43_00035 [Candidatus Saccharibacteria bacterium]|nr:hypothetical protein [Candidatus Saccharibacteria bacterium]
MEVEQKKKKIHGGRNLVILGVVATILALITTGVSLIIYHNSGDIYLDRSRPGYLPDEEEIEQESEEEEYSLEKSGKLTMEVIEEYLEKLKADVKAIDAYEKPFDENVLSDERLGIPAVGPEE